MNKSENTHVFHDSRKNKRGHYLMMLICCALPLLLLIAAVSFFDLGKAGLYWLVFLLCPLMHFVMMRKMHENHSDKKEGGCH